MAVVLSCNEIGKSHGARKLFDSLSLTVDDGQRLGLIGPNGSGKTTLLRILAGLETADSGVRSVRKLAKVGYVPQDSVFPDGSTVRGVMQESLADAPLDEVEREVRIGVALGKVGFTDDSAPTASLSGGWKKRLSIAAQLVREPDLLLLDEPTNHLDLEGIEWLEKLLAGENFACVFVSHDRYFLENVAQEVAEVNKVFPDGLFRAAGSYSTFLEKREDHLAALQKQQDALANRVRREIEWLRRGPKARTGKSRARIDSAGRMIDELGEAEARSRGGVATIDFTASERKTKRLAAAEGVAKAMDGRTLFRDLDFVLMPGSRLGIVGPNGSGKTTLLRVILGELQPDAGEVQRAANLRKVALDQHRTRLNPNEPLRRALAPDGDTVQFRGQPVHVAGWAKRFLFQAEQLDQPVATLSGGERARAAIARLMTEEADILTLDEPTNDLDIPTLEALEETLLEFPGALVLITHDRYLLDRVCNSVIGLDGDGEAGQYADYLQWEQARDERRKSRVVDKPKPVAAAPQPEKKARKLSYHEQREWDAMEGRILEAETELEAATEAMNNPDGVSDPKVLMDRHARMEKAQAEVDQLYARWAELEEKVS
ncbi:MAG: ABC-F family ATP-binding cassette domain-containing protein [Bryobacterales bacterium]|nr:ABC-F family ATP-binding cassette domain-containing protein [Acidobacteriota bacterium]MCB9383162.1 ABC-F family ATP-binding cassette domain-containing protein [Bryobacterales bacterium]